MKTLAEVEKEHILQALTLFGGNKTKAAQALGVTIKTLYNKLHEYGEFERFAVHKAKKEDGATQTESELLPTSNEEVAALPKAKQQTNLSSVFDQLK